MDKKLNDQELVFVKYYLVELKPYDAAKAANYAETTSRTKAFTWVSEGKCPANKIHVYNAIQKAKQKRLKRVEVDADAILEQLDKMRLADVADILDDNKGFRPLSEWPLIWRQMVSAMDVQEIFGGQGEDRKAVGEMIKVKFVNRLKVIELAGKHVTVNAFVEKKEILHLDGRAKRLANARERSAIELVKDSKGVYRDAK